MRTDIQTLLEIAGDLHFKEVVHQAEVLMKKHKNIKSFCMCMGSAVFFTYDGEPMVDQKYLIPFYDFLNEFDGELHTTGRPVRIDRVDGILRQSTDW